MQRPRGKTYMKLSKGTRFALGFTIAATTTGVVAWFTGILLEAEKIKHQHAIAIAMVSSGLVAGASAAILD
jgi:cytochrome c biogenesis protein CcdA